MRLRQTNKRYLLICYGKKELLPGSTLGQVTEYLEFYPQVFFLHHILERSYSSL